MPRLSLHSRYSLVLLAAAGVILALGIVFKPRKQASAQQLSESELFRLQQTTTQRRLDDLAEFLSDAADRAAVHLLYIKQPPYTAVVRDDKAVTSGVDRATVSAVNSRGDVFDLTRAASPADGTLEVFDIPPHDRPAPASPRPAAAEISAGDWVLAVARNAERQPVFAQGLYQSSGPARCGDFAYTQVYSSVPLSEALVGGGLFTLDGDLLGVIADCAGHPLVMDVQSIDEALHRPVPVTGRLLALYGLGVAEAAGLRVTAVWTGGRASRAGIMPGDVIAAADNRAVAA
ncbi:MAG TPA: S1C family serine protease, partial [Bryobacteraceae bacterium]|nr:S1C family serine protease [Bryobacteraceae bacterium]